MSDAMWQLQKAVYTQLSNDSSLSDLITGVYNYVPDDTNFPYVVIGKMKSEDWSTITTSGVQIVFNVEVFSQDKSAKTYLDITSRVYELLHHVGLLLTGHTLINIGFVTSEIMQKSDGITTQVVNKFKAMIEKN